MENNKKIKVEITEIFMAKAGLGMKGFDRCFHGSIKREKDENGNPVVRGEIVMHDGYHYDNVEMEWVRNEKVNVTGQIYAMAEDQWKLGNKLDELVILVVDKGLHNNKGIFIECANSKIYMN